MDLCFPMGAYCLGPTTTLQQYENRCYFNLAKHECELVVAFSGPPLSSPY